MFNWVAFLILGLSNGTDYPMAKVKTLVECAIPPEEAGIIYTPCSITVEATDKGRIFVVDASERKIFIWDHKGQFMRTLSRQGEGPGELMIEDKRASIVVTDKHIVVIDDRVRRISFWNKDDYTFEKRIDLRKLSRVLDFHHFNDSYVLVSANHRRADMRLYKVDSNFQIEKQLARVDDNVFRKNEKNGFIYNPLAGRLITSAGPDDLWYANTSENWVRQVDLNGKVLKEHRIPMPVKPITKGEVNYHKREFNTWRRPKDEIVKFENLPIFETIVSLNNGHILGLQFMRDDASFKGYMLKKDTGEIVAKYWKIREGDNGYVTGVNGNLAFMETNKDGDYELKIRSVEAP